MCTFAGMCVDKGVWANEGACVCAEVSVCDRGCVCACVCVRVCVCADEGVCANEWARVCERERACVPVCVFVSICGGAGGGVPVSVCLGRPIHRAAPECQPMTRSSLTYRKMRKTGAICELLKPDEVGREDRSSLREAERLPWKRG